LKIELYINHPAGSATITRLRRGRGSWPGRWENCQTREIDEQVPCGQAVEASIISRIIKNQ